MFALYPLPASPGIKRKLWPCVKQRPTCFDIWGPLRSVGGPLWQSGCSSAEKASESHCGLSDSQAQVLENKKTKSTVLVRGADWGRVDISMCHTAFKSKARTGGVTEGHRLYREMDPWLETKLQYILWMTISQYNSPVYNNCNTCLYSGYSCENVVHGCFCLYITCTSREQHCTCKIDLRASLLQKQPVVFHTD